MVVVRLISPQEDLLDQQLLFPDEEQPILTKDELNLAEFPLCLPTRRHPAGRNEIHVTIDGLDSERNPTRREWIVNGSQLHGLPLAIDEEVLLGLMYLLQKNGARSPRVEFTRYSLFKLLGWQTDSKRSYVRLQQCLHRLTGAEVTSKGTFWDHAARRHVNKENAFHIIESFQLCEFGASIESEPPWEAIMAADNSTYELPDADPRFRSCVVFGDTIFQSIQAGFIKTLDFTFYQSLELPLSQRLFRYLDKKKYHTLLVEVGLLRLAECLAMTGHTYPSQIKRALESAHQELITRGYVEAVRYRRTDQSENVVYKLADVTPAKLPRSPNRPSSTILDEDPPSPPSSVPVSVPIPIVALLVVRGMTRHEAENLVATFPAERITAQIEAFDHRIKNNSHELSRNPAGFLRRAIERDFALPRGFVSQGEREHKRQAREAAKRRQADEKTAAQRTETETLERFERLFSSLPDVDRGAIMDEATARLDQFARRSFNQERAEGRSEGPGHWVLRGHRNAILAGRDAGAAQPSDQNGGPT